MMKPIVKGADMRSPQNPSSETVGHKRYLNLLESIIEVTHGLFRPSQLEQAMGQVLAKTGSVMGIDRAYFLGLKDSSITSISPNSGEMCPLVPNFFAWGRQSPSARYDSSGHWLQKSLSQSSVHPIWQLLSQGQLLQGTIETMPVEIATDLKAQRVRAILLLPILENEQLMGILGFEDCHCGQAWTDPEISVLKQLSQILGAALKQFHVESRLSHYAFHDPLTELPNRALLLNRLDQCIKRKARMPSYAFAVLYLDLDRFKPVNDRLGHEIGDRLLVQVAQRISRCIRPGDTVARLGGDEFVILLDEIIDISDAEAVIRRLRSTLTQRFHIDGNDLYIDVSVGVSLSSMDAQSAEAILQKADLAMYRAKHSGKGCYRIFESSMHVQMMQKTETESDMHLALQNKEFDVHYQPIIDLATGQIKGFEALARWNHPVMGLLEPGHFIPIAEETGMIKALGMQVLRLACEQTVQWQHRLPEYQSLTINVNLSAKQFAQQDLVQQIENILLQTHLPPTSLHLELTESCIIRKDQGTLALIHQLRDLGIQIYLDDFGAGYSSLQYLNFFPLNGLKIDRAFTQKLSISRETQAIVRSVIVLAQALNMDIVVEGIENQQQIDFLQYFHNIAGQGFLFSKPLGADHALAFLRDPNLVVGSRKRA